MGEITERHTEWATVHRMQQMLHTPHPDFEETHTFSMLSSILCWTMQRIRTVPVKPDGPPDRAERQRQARKRDPNFDAVDALQLQLFDSSVGQVFPEMVMRSGSEESDLNMLPRVDDAGTEISALALLIALRNAFAHGDGRKVIPINQDYRLIGFEVELSSPSGFPEWRQPIRLNRSGMCEIANLVAELFCNALISPMERWDIEQARQIAEAA